MIGNKFATEELAKNFQQRMSKLHAIKKQASVEREETSALGANSKVAQVNPEDFLVTPSEQIDVHGKDLEEKIQEVSSYAEDPSCKKCGKGHMAEDGCATEAPPMAMADDMSYLTDRKAEYVLHQLGKVAGEMRAEGKSFAADMIQATAIQIKNQAVKKASDKLSIVTGLRKMAKNAYDGGDKLTGDVVTVTINKITA
jgi:hypothetical protein